MSWIDEAIRELEAGRQATGPWSYRSLPAQGQPAVEPTSLAAMALLAHGRPADAAVQWLLAMQQRDGGFPIGEGHDESSWATAIACLALRGAGYGEAADRAAAWLLQVPTFAIPVSPGSPYGYDTSLTAWPWTPSDYSWVEPTALALLALRRSPGIPAERIEQGRRLLLERATHDGAEGGWNYGEPAVLGARLSPAVVPTALAILSLCESDADLTAAVAFLHSRRDSTLSLFSVAWAANAVAAVRAFDLEWSRALEAAWVAGNGSSPTRTAARRGVATAVALLAVAEREKNPLLPDAIP